MERGGGVNQCISTARGIDIPPFIFEHRFAPIASISFMVLGFPWVLILLNFITRLVRQGDKLTSV